jgi:hypothetical protein
LGANSKGCEQEKLREREREREGRGEKQIE